MISVITGQGNAPLSIRKSVCASQKENLEKKPRGERDEYRVSICNIIRIPGKFIICILLPKLNLKIITFTLILIFYLILSYIIN